jgi:hypothetical protein
MTPTRALLVVALAVALAGCGGDDRGLSESAADALQADVAAVVDGVRAKDGARARNALKELRAEVARQLAADEITEAGAAEIRAAADALPLPAMPVVRPSPTPAPEVRPAGDGEAEERKKGRGKRDDDDDKGDD